MVVGLAIPPSKNMLDIEATASTPSLVKLWPYISYGCFMELIEEYLKKYAAQTKRCRRTRSKSVSYFKRRPGTEKKA